MTIDASRSILLRLRPFLFLAPILIGVSAASAQTVVVRGTDPSTPIELAVNEAVAATGSTNAEGIGTLVVPAPGINGGTQTTTQIFVDRCSGTRRIVMAQPGGIVLPAGACERQQLQGTFITQPATTFVFNLSGPVASMLLTQRNPPSAWLKPPSPEGESAASWGESPTGIMVFGGGTLAKFGNITSVACGNVTGCDSKTLQFGYHVGALIWLMPYLGIEGQYIDPQKASASGSDTGYTFSSELDTNLVTVAGLVGAPLGRARIYGRAGLNRHGTTFRTTQTTNAVTVTTDTGSFTSPAVTQTTELRTETWSWVFGGGVEGWLSHMIAIYGEVNKASVKGDALGVPEGTIDEKPWLIQTGVRVRLPFFGNR